MDATLVSVGREFSHDKIHKDEKKVKIMVTINTENNYEQELVSNEYALPAAPFPLKYVHCVFDNLYDARQTVRVLNAAGYTSKAISLMTGENFVEAVERSYTFLGFLTSVDLDSYLSAARSGSYILSVHPASHGQIERMPAVLAPNHARLAKYIDTWTVIELLS